MVSPWSYWQLMGSPGSYALLGAFGLSWELLGAPGEHEALKRDMKRARPRLKKTIPLQIYPTASREMTLRRPAMGGPDALLASIWRT